MVYGNSFTNPIIYNACNEEFRKSFRSYFRILIKPCARLILGDRLNWEAESPQILDDLGTTFQRTRSLRRTSSRRETLTNANARLHGEIMLGRRDTLVDNVNTRTNGEIPNRHEDNYRPNRKTYQSDENNDHICFKHTGRTNHYGSVPYRNGMVVQYVSALWHKCVYFISSNFSYIILRHDIVQSLVLGNTIYNTKTPC